MLLIVIGHGGTYGGPYSSSLEVYFPEFDPANAESILGYVKSAFRLNDEMIDEIIAIRNDTVIASHRF
jgi:hypothetical protein